MRAVLVLLGGAAVFATGVVAGVVTATEGDASGAPPPAVVVLRGKDGLPHEVSPSEAAARIARLEDLVARMPRARAPVPDADPEDGTTTASAPPPELPNVEIPKRPDGEIYSFEELRRLALSSPDPVLRRDAIRALRRDDSDEARATLREVTADAQTPADLRIEAAKALAKPPHRDAAPEELVSMLQSADLPAEVRREIADGVVRLRDRGAWMSEIAGQMAKEGDAEVRKLLFESVVRSAWDPAAREQLLAVAGSEAASLDDRRSAVAALVRSRDAKTLDTLTRFLGHGDPGLRESAVLALGGANRLSVGEIAAAMADGSAAVRAAAFAARLPNLAKGASDEEKAARGAALDAAIRLATSDPDPGVRRSALAWTGAMPKDERERVLDLARNDANPLVQIEGYARSPGAVVKEQPDRILSALESQDAKVRDAAYRLVARTWGVDVPFRAQWNPKARAAAVASIRAQVAARQ